MGEVYRADDLTLGNSVALKFLPAELARDPERLARFHPEVRTVRQVSQAVSRNRNN
jgi:serine/threonine-protein kinase